MLTRSHLVDERRVKSLTDISHQSVPCDRLNVGQGDVIVSPDRRITSKQKLIDRSAAPPIPHNRKLGSLVSWFSRSFHHPRKRSKMRLYDDQLPELEHAENPALSKDISEVPESQGCKTEQCEETEESEAKDEPEISKIFSEIADSAVLGLDNLRSPPGKHSSRQPLRFLQKGSHAKRSSDEQHSRLLPTEQHIPINLQPIDSCNRAPIHNDKLIREGCGLLSIYPSQRCRASSTGNVKDDIAFRPSLYGLRQNSCSAIGRTGSLKDRMNYSPTRNEENGKTAIQRQHSSDSGESLEITNHSIRLLENEDVLTPLPKFPPAHKSHHKRATSPFNSRQCIKGIRQGSCSALVSSSSLRDGRPRLTIKAAPATRIRRSNISSMQTGSQQINVKNCTQNGPLTLQSRYIQQELTLIGQDIDFCGGERIEDHQTPNETTVEAMERFGHASTGCLDFSF